MYELTARHIANIIMHKNTIHVTTALQEILPLTLLSRGCTYEANLMEGNRSTAVRVDRGKEDVLEQDFGKSQDQHGDLECGRAPLVVTLTLFSYQLQ